MRFDYRHCTFIILSFTIALLSRPVVAEETYSIHLTRPDSVGLRYTVSVEGEATQSQTFSQAGKPPQKRDSHSSVQIQGTLHVLAIDPEQQATKVEFAVNKCLREDKAVLAPGTLVLAQSANGQTQYTIDGIPAAPETAEVLRMAVMTHQPGQLTENAIFGTNIAQPVGGEWRINAQAAASEAHRSGLPTKPENIQGQAKLAAVRARDGKQVMEVEAELNVTHLTGPMPNNAQLQDGSSIAHYSAILPLDQDSQPLSQSQSMELHLTMLLTGPKGEQATLQVDISRKSKVIYGEAK